MKGRSAARDFSAPQNFWKIGKERLEYSETSTIAELEGRMQLQSNK
jgi:hypothetical protein